MTPPISGPPQAVSTQTVIVGERCDQYSAGRGLPRRARMGYHHRCGLDTLLRNYSTSAVDIYEMTKYSGGEAWIYNHPMRLRNTLSLSLCLLILAINTLRMTRTSNTRSSTRWRSSRRGVKAKLRERLGVFLFVQFPFQLLFSHESLQQPFSLQRAL